MVSVKGAQQKIRLPDVRRHLWLAGAFHMINLLVLFELFFRQQVQTGSSNLPMARYTDALLPLLQKCQVSQQQQQQNGDGLKQQAIIYTQNFLQQSFNRSYAQFPECPRDQSLHSCIQNFLDDHTEVTDRAEFPWWYRTMLGAAINENGQLRGLEGRWHFLNSNAPNFRMCAIEKNGNTQWRKVACQLNKNNNESYTDFVESTGDDVTSNGTECFYGDPVPPLDIPSFAFLRDPLERFLSGFLDKCVVNRAQGFCRPAQLFNRPPKGLLQNRKLMFNAYVDSFPLDWDMHFFPQSVYCDGLYRHIHTEKYDFVGFMGPNFYRDVKTVGDLYGKDMWSEDDRTRFQAALEDVYRLSEKNLTFVSNVGVETKASEKVLEYYSPRTVRRVLEYFSIDYLLLNLTVPLWAQTMLLQDGAEQQQQLATFS